MYLILHLIALASQAKFGKTLLSQSLHLMRKPNVLKMFSEFPNFYVTGKLVEVLCNLLCTLEWEDRERKDSISAKISSCLSSTFLHSSQGHHRTLHNCLMQGLLFSDFVCGCWSTTESLLTHNSNEETTALASFDTVSIKGEGRPTWHSHLRARENHLLLQTWLPL